MRACPKVHTLGGFSAHAGQSGLVNWAAPFRASKPRMFLTHGEDGPRTALRDQLKARFGLDPAMPRYGDEVELEQTLAVVVSGPNSILAAEAGSQGTQDRRTAS
jgi:hypothetical protein